MASIIAGDGAAAAGLPTPEEVANNPTVCQNQTYVGHETLRQAHLPIRERGLGLTSSSSIKDTVYIDCHALVLGRVVAASTRGTFYRFLNGYLSSALIHEMKTVAAEVKRRQKEDAVGSSWASLSAEEDSQERERETVLVELSQAKRGVGGVCVGVVPRVQLKLLRALYAHRGEKLLQDLQSQKRTAMKRAMVRFRGARKKGAMAFVECLGVSQEDTMEGPLWKETLGRSLGLHDAAELVGGMCHGNGCRPEPPASTSYPAQI